MTRKNFKTVFIKKLEDMEGKDLKNFKEVLGISRQVFYSWKIGGIPNAEVIRKLVSVYGFEYADFFEYVEEDNLLD